MQGPKVFKVFPPWGHAPVSVLPAVLCDYWNEVQLPGWACDELGLKVGATYGALGVAAWQSDSNRISKAFEVLLGRAVTVGGADLHDLPAMPSEGVEGIDLGSLPFRTRTRNLVRRMGWDENPGALAGLTIGDLLKIRGMGAISLIDLMCLVETACLIKSDDVLAQSDARGATSQQFGNERLGALDDLEAEIAKLSARAVQAWGVNGTPLLPRFARRVLSGGRLPEDVCHGLGLATGATYDELSDTGWESDVEVAPREVLNTLAEVIGRGGVASSMTPFQMEIPSTAHLLTLPFSTRAHNVLYTMFEEGVDLRARLTSLENFSSLLQIRGMGEKTALETVCVVEAASLERSREVELIKFAAQSGDADRLRQRLLDLVDAAWVHQVSGADPRFAKFLVRGRETVFEQIDRFTRDSDCELIDELRLAISIPAIEKEMARIEGLGLEEALADLLQATGPHSATWESMLIARFGWSGDTPKTLQEAGSIGGVTRERVRQRAKSVLAKLPEHEVYLPALDRALRLIEANAPIKVEDASRLLQSKGVAVGQFCPEAVLSVAEQFGRDLTVRIKSTRESRFLESEASGLVAGPIVESAKAVARRSGVVNLANLVSILGEKGAAPDSLDCREVLQACVGAVFCGDDWFWLPRERQNIVLFVTRKVLSVVSPVHLRTLRDALTRFCRYRESACGWSHTVVPPRGVLESFFRQHPDFRVNEEGLLESRLPVSFEEVLSRNEVLILECLRQSSTGFMLRADLHRACAERGVNPNTLDTYLSYYPCFERVAENHWSVRGTRIDPAVLAASVEASGNCSQIRRGLGFGWKVDGCLWVAARLPETLHRYVLPIPAAIRRFLVGRTFEARSQSGVHCGELKIADYGVRGLGDFLSRSGADEDDILFVSFDLAAGSSQVWLGDDVELEALDPSR